jgi:hypothetical protein
MKVFAATGSEMDSGNEVDLRVGFCDEWKRALIDAYFIVLRNLN